MAYDTLGRVEKTVQGNVNYEIVTEYDEWSREKNKRYRPAGTANGDPLEWTCATTYDSAGRLETMTDSNISPQPFTYAYHSRTNLIDQLTHPNGLVQDKEWDSRSLLESIQTRDNVGSVLKSFTYGLNALAQRETIERETGTVLTFGYDQRRQVTSGEKTTDGTAFPIFDYSYQFDEIGNRESATDLSSSSSTYTANALNQYSSITTGSAVVSPTHDANGSLLNDGRIICTWDERNRMKNVEEVDSGKKSEMLYDAVGRRLARKDLDASDIIAKTTRYLYDGWNCVAEFESTGIATTFVRTKTYTWGLDLSGTKQGAGGVGGLCAVKDEPTSTSYHYSADGNGNLVGLYTDSQTEAATYEYSPFGQVITQSGPYAQENTYRFSTKPENDWAGGQNYYGYRFYDSGSGRWLSRDPLSEKGSQNLYAQSENNTLYNIDFLGLSTIQITATGFSIPEGYAFSGNGDITSSRGYLNISGNFSVQRSSEYVNSQRNQLTRNINRMISLQSAAQAVNWEAGGFAALGWQPNQRGLRGRAAANGIGAIAAVVEYGELWADTRRFSTAISLISTIQRNWKAKCTQLINRNFRSEQMKGCGCCILDLYVRLSNPGTFGGGLLGANPTPPTGYPIGVAKFSEVRFIPQPCKYARDPGRETFYDRRLFDRTYIAHDY